MPRSKSESKSDRRARVAPPGRVLLVAAGTLCVVLGLIGIFVPLLPTTPFLLLAAACFARGSERMHRWLFAHRLFGRYLSGYREGRGLPLASKLTTLALLWTTIGISVVAVLPGRLWWVKALIVAVALVVTLHILRIGKRRR